MMDERFSIDGRHKRVKSLIVMVNQWVYSHTIKETRVKGHPRVHKRQDISLIETLNDEKGFRERR